MPKSWTKQFLCYVLILGKLVFSLRTPLHMIIMGATHNCWALRTAAIQALMDRAVAVKSHFCGGGDNEIGTTLFLFDCP